MQVLCRSLSAPNLQHVQKTVSKVQRPLAAESVGVFTAAMADIARCEASLKDTPTASETLLARTAPLAKKEQLVNYFGFDALSRGRRAQRRATAAGQGCTPRRQAAYASGPLVQFGTACTSIFLGGAAWCGTRLVRGVPPRTMDGVREDKVLRSLQRLQDDLKPLRQAYVVGQAQANYEVWRSRCTQLSARFDKM